MSEQTLTYCNNCKVATNTTYVLKAGNSKRYCARCRKEKIGMTDWERLRR